MRTSYNKYFPYPTSNLDPVVAPAKEIQPSLEQNVTNPSFEMRIELPPTIKKSFDKVFFEIGEMQNFLKHISDVIVKKANINDVQTEMMLKADKTGVEQMYSILDTKLHSKSSELEQALERTCKSMIDDNANTIKSNKEVMEKMDKVTASLAKSEEKVQLTMKGVLDKVDKVHIRSGSLERDFAEAQRISRDKILKLWNSMDEIRQFYENIKFDLNKLNLTLKQNMEEHDLSVNEKVTEFTTEMQIKFNDFEKGMASQLDVYKRNIMDAQDNLNTKLKAAMNTLLYEKGNFSKMAQEQIAYIKANLNKSLMNEVQEYIDKKLGTYFQSEQFLKVQNMELHKALEPHINMVNERTENQDTEISSLKLQIDTLQQVIKKLLTDNQKIAERQNETFQQIKTLDNLSLKSDALSMIEKVNSRVNTVDHKVNSHIKYVQSLFKDMDKKVEKKLTKVASMPRLPVFPRLPPPATQQPQPSGTVIQTNISSPEHSYVGENASERSNSDEEEEGKEKLTQEEENVGIVPISTTHSVTTISSAPNTARSTPRQPPTIDVKKPDSLAISFEVALSSGAPSPAESPKGYIPHIPLQKQPSQSQLSLALPPMQYTSQSSSQANSQSNSQATSPLHTMKSPLTPSVPSNQNSFRQQPPSPSIFQQKDPEKVFKPPTQAVTPKESALDTSSMSEEYRLLVEKLDNMHKLVTPRQKTQPLRLETQAPKETAQPQQEQQPMVPEAEGTSNEAEKRPDTAWMSQNDKALFNTLKQLDKSEQHEDSNPDYNANLLMELRIREVIAELHELNRQLRTKASKKELELVMQKLKSMELKETNKTVVATERMQEIREMIEASQTQLSVSAAKLSITPIPERRSGFSGGKVRVRPKSALARSKDLSQSVEIQKASQQPPDSPKEAPPQVKKPPTIVIRTKPSPPASHRAWNATWKSMLPN